MGHYSKLMPNLIAFLVTLLFVAANVWLWSLKHAPIVLFWESMAVAAIAFPALFWFVTRFTR